MDQLPSGEIVGSVRFSRYRFAEGTIPALVAGYRRLLATSVAGLSG